MKASEIGKEGASASSPTCAPIPRAFPKTPCATRGLTSRERYGTRVPARRAQRLPNRRRTRRMRTKAIRPTSMAYTPEMVEKYLAEDEMKLYRLIWNRFVASQMMPALYDQTTIDVAATGKNGVDYTLPRHRIGAQVRRLPEGLRGRQGPDRRGRRGAEASPAAGDRGRDAAVQGAQARAALHRAAAALQRSHAGEAAGSRRRGPALHLRFDSFHHSGARVRARRRAAASSPPNWAWW